MQRQKEEKNSGGHMQLSRCKIKNFNGWKYTTHFSNFVKQSYNMEGNICNMMNFHLVSHCPGNVSVC